MRVKSFDYWILLTVLALLSIGVIMVFSASAPYAYVHHHGDTYYYLKKQLIFSTLGVAAMLIASKINYKKFAAASPVILIGSIVLLMLVLIVGSSVNGSRRWFNLGFVSFQPSELAKLSIILFFSWSLSRRGENLRFFWRGLVPYLLIIGIFSGLLMKEPHFSGTILVCSVAVILLFSAGARIWHFILLSVPALGALVYLATREEYRMARILTFLDPWKDKTGTGWQIINSLYAIGSGGIFGRGLGKSLQKYLYIPEPHNDFIFSVMAEELGFIGVVTVLTLFLIFIWRGIRVAMHAPDVTGSLIAVGVVSLVAVQVIINVAVVTSSMPVTGMPLPFISSGGSSLVLLLTGIGILLNISRHTSSI